MTDRPPFHRLTTEWSSDSPVLAPILALIAQADGENRAELEALLHIAQARFAWAEADRLRNARVDKERRAAARKERVRARGGSIPS